MSRTARITLVFALVASPVIADPVGRTVPAECAPQGGVENERVKREAGPSEAEHAWNASFRSAYESIERGDHESALSSICTALGHAADFGPRDWRFAESLDELGLIHFMRADYERSAAAQAGAVAEILLALGPRPSEATMRECGANVETYAARLAQPLGRLGREADAAAIQKAPFRVFTLGLVRVDRPLATRLGWLVSEYLGKEDLTAARSLQELIDGARAEASR